MQDAQQYSYSQAPSQAELKAPAVVSGLIVLLIIVCYVISQAVSVGSPEALLSDWDSIWKIVLLLGGMLLGLTLLKLDESMLVHHYTQLVPNSLDSVAETAEPQHHTVPHPITRSTIFLILYIPLAFFMYTSSGSALGIGLMIGLGVGLALELWMYKDHSQAFAQRFLTQLTRPVSPTEQHRAVWIFVAAVTALVLLTVFKV